MNPVAYYNWVEHMDITTLAVTVSAIFAFAIICIIMWRKVHQADMVKHDFVSMVTHKLRTPLTAAKWATETLKGMEKDPHKLELISAIDTAHERLTSLMASLIDLANANHTGSKSRMVRTALLPLVQKVVEQMKVLYLEKGIVFTVQYPDTDAEINVDIEQISFVLQTLLENAHHYTPAHGRVTFTITYKGLRVDMVVMDTGIGIVQQELGHICSKSYRSDLAKQADPDGFGIGLYLSRGILARHHGSITVSSKGLNKGSTFTVSLPIQK